MVLAMFVDAGRVQLLSALAGGSVFVTPTVLDPNEIPPFSCQPLSEFARGLFHAQSKQGQALYAQRVQRRTAFITTATSPCKSVQMSVTELQQAQYLTSPAARGQAKQVDPNVRIKRISLGEAECAAVAVTRGWVLWSDDNAIIGLVNTLYPGHPVERISDMLARAVDEGFIACQDAADLYNHVFHGSLNLWTTLSARCSYGRLVYA